MPSSPLSPIRIHAFIPRARWHYTDHTLLDRAAQPADSTAHPPRLAYLLSAYPAISHTFFLREILALRARGFEIHAASINPPDRAQLPPEEQREAAAAFYLKPPRTARTQWLARLFTLLAALAAHPIVALRGLRAAASMPRASVLWTLRLGYWAEAMLLGQWMRRRSLTHLHVHFGGPVSSVALLTARAWQIPWSLTLHGPGEFHDQTPAWLHEKILSATRIFAISSYTRSQVLRLSPEAESKTFVLRLGVEPALLAQPLAAPGSTPASAPLEILCTGRLVSAKGQRILLQAFAALPQRDSLRLVFIGNGPDRDSLHSLAATLGIAHQVEWTGALDHAATLDRVARAQLFVLASFAEGLPVALMEAMALGVPCISTFIAGIPELIRSGENGLLVPAGNVPALTAAMRQLLDDPDLRRRFAEHARQTVAAEYNLARNLDPLAEHLTVLCAAASSGSARHA